MEFNQLRKLIVKRLLNEASEEDIRLLEQWQDESEANRQLMEKLVSEVFLKTAIGDKNKQMRLQEWKRLEMQTVGKRQRVIRLRWLRMAAAVCVLGMAGLSVWLLKKPALMEEPTPLVQQIRAGSSKAVVELAGGEQFFFTKDSTFQIDQQGVQMANRQDTLNIISHSVTASGKQEFHTIRIPNGGEYIARLEDGSVIHLNAGSELKVPVDFGVGGRHVWLKGEAFFSVAHNPEQKFTVHTNKAEISVLGTEFDVRAYGDEKEVVTTLVEGSVEVASGAASGRLKPGYQSRVAKMGTIVTEKVNVYPFIAWKTGRMVFENQRLEQIMSELQRWYDFEVFYTNPEVKDMCFTIDILKYDDVSKVLRLMEKMEKISFVQKGHTVTLGSR